MTGVAVSGKQLVETASPENVANRKDSEVDAHSINSILPRIHSPAPLHFPQWKQSDLSANVQKKQEGSASMSVGKVVSSGGPAGEARADEPNPAAYGRPSAHQPSPPPQHPYGMAPLKNPGTERRVNPKTLHTKTVRPSAALLQGLKNIPHPEYRVEERLDNTDLHRLCDAVPYLLGTRACIDSMNRLADMPLPSNALQDEHGRNALDPGQLSSKDKALMQLLLMVQTPERERHRVVRYLLRGLLTQGDLMVLYKDVSRPLPEVEMVNYPLFLDLAIAWKELPNPALVARDGPAAITPWATIVRMLRERGIDPNHIDKRLYYELVIMSEGEQLDKRLGLLQREAESGELKQKAERSKRVAAGMGPNYFSYRVHRPIDPTALFSKRFSHEHPKGKIIDPNDPEDVYIFTNRPPNPNTHQKPTIREVQQAIRNKKRAWLRTKVGKAVKLIVGLTVLLGFAAGLVAVLFFSVGQKKKSFTEQTW